VALAALAVLCAVAAFHAQRIAWLPLAVLWCLLGAWCAWMEPHPAPAPALAALSDGLLRIVEGTVVDAGPVRGEIEQSVDEPTVTEQRPSQRIDLRVSSLEVVTDAADAQAPAVGGVRLHRSLAGPERLQSARYRQPAILPMRRSRSRRCPVAPTGDLSRSRRLEPPGFPPRSGHHLHGHGEHPTVLTG